MSSKRRFKNEKDFDCCSCYRNDRQRVRWLRRQLRTRVLRCTSCLHARRERFRARERSRSAEETFNFKLAENQPADNPISKGMNKFAELVAEKSGGTVNVEVYLDAQLGTENETIDQVQAGTLDFARINTSALASTADEVGVFTLPYVFTSTEQKYKVLDGEIGQGVSDALQKYNMIGLGYWEAGSRNFYTTKKPIKSVADMKGMKIRVQQSDVAIKMVELLGAAATPMAYGEVYQGLQTGVIDGAENDFCFLLHLRSL